MNSSADTLLDPWNDFLLAQNISLARGSWVTLAVSGFQIFILIYLTWRHYVSVKAGVTSISSAHASFFRPVDILILLFISSNYLQILFGLLEAFASSSDRYTAYNIAGNFFAQLFCVLVMVYSYLRSSAVVQAVAGWSIPYVRAYIVPYSLVQIGAFVLTVLANYYSDDTQNSLILAETYLSLCGEVMLFAFDLGLMVIFITFLRNREGIVSARGHMLIVSKYGVASFVCFQLYLANVLALTGTCSLKGNEH
ncbi:hypothetical protein BC830DRAFT_1127150 [Chytriomyces sp. MP71]|nr:hypothetical protein BC830DRAFT_1127150 [Chytriomyces sp. MP71]